MKPNTLIALALVFMLSLSMLAFAQSTTQQPTQNSAQGTEHKHHHDMEGKDCPCHKKAAEAKDATAKDAKACCGEKCSEGCCADGKCKGGECCKDAKHACCGGDKAKASKGDCCGGEKCNRKGHQPKAA